MILTGDALTELKKLDGGIAQTCITSPPYWGLRDYGVDGQLGLEPTPEEYISRLVEIFAEVKRVLRDDGTLWLVLGDSYASNPASGGIGQQEGGEHQHTPSGSYQRPPGLKPKDLCMIPARVALALQADGWWLRSDIIWFKSNPMPESVTDRPTSAHEHIFLLAKSQRYFYDADAIAEIASYGDRVDMPRGSFNGKYGDLAFRAIRATRNKRNVWTVATKPYPEAHFAVYPPALIEPCVLAGSADRACEVCGAPWDRVVELGDVTSRGGGSKGARGRLDIGRNDYPEEGFCAKEHITTGLQPTCSCDNEGTAQSIILDPFMGSGTTGEVALKHRRKFIGIELNPEYVKLAEKRLREVEMVMF